MKFLTNGFDVPATLLHVDQDRTCLKSTPQVSLAFLTRFDLNFCELFQLPLSLLFLQCLLPLHGFFFVLFPGFLHQVIARLLQDLPVGFGSPTRKQQQSTYSFHSYRTICSCLIPTQAAPFFQPSCHFAQIYLGNSTQKQRKKSRPLRRGAILCW